MCLCVCVLQYLNGNVLFTSLTDTIIVDIKLLSIFSCALTAFLMAYP